MVQFVGIRSKGRRILAMLLALVMATLLCGCNITDRIRPELNQEGLMRVDPSTIVVDFPDAQVNVAYGPTLDDVLNSGSSSGDSSSGDSSSGDDINHDTSIGSNSNANTTNGFTINGKMIVDPANFVALPASVVEAKDYATYLEEHVNKPVQELLDKLSSAQKKEGVYFRILYAGYNQNPESGMLERATPYKVKTSYSCSEVGGTSLGAFAIDHLQQISYNATAVAQARNTAKTVLQNFMNTNTPPDGFDSWESVDWLAASATRNFPKNQLAMWGNERVGAQTLGEYLAKMERETVGVVPNIRLKVFTSATSSSTLLINRVSTVYVSRYLDMMTSRDVDLLFTEFNQFGNRKSNTLQKCYSDTTSVLYAYSDGYNKCLVLIATKPDKDLGDVLDTYYNDICSIVASVIPPNRWKDVQALYPELGIASQGSKGAD